MNQQDPGRAYRRKANGEGAGRRQWQRYRKPSAEKVTREPHDRHGNPLDARTGTGDARQDSGTTRPRSSRGQGTGSAPRRRVLPWVAGLAVVGAGTAAGFVAASDDVSITGESAPEPYPREESHAPLLDQARLDAVAAALKKATGSTQAIDFWVESDGRMRVQVPPETPGALAEEYWWEDGKLELSTASKSLDELPFDLTDVDPAALVRTDEDARRRSDGEISSSLARVHKPTYKGDHWVYVRVSEVDHGAVVLWTDQAGNVESDLVNEDWRDD